MFFFVFLGSSDYDPLWTDFGDEDPESGGLSTSSHNLRNDLGQLSSGTIFVFLILGLINFIIFF